MPIVIASFFLAMTALFYAKFEPQQDVQAKTIVADATATSVLAYREGVIDYLNANPGFSGVVTNAMFTPLTGAIRNTSWVNVVSGGALYIYEVSPSNEPYLLDQIYRKSGKSHMVGRNVSGTLVSTNGLSTGVTVPAVVPNGSIIFVGK